VGIRIGRARNGGMVVSVDSSSFDAFMEVMAEEMAEMENEDRQQARKVASVLFKKKKPLAHVTSIEEFFSEKGKVR